MKPQEAITVLKSSLEIARHNKDVFEKAFPSQKSNYRIDIEVYEMAISALEKQIPKFVLCPKGFQGIRDTRYYCPACKSLTRQHEAICHKCGQAVKYPKEVYNKAENKIVLNWSDTE